MWPIYLNIRIYSPHSVPYLYFGIHSEILKDSQFSWLKSLLYLQVENWFIAGNVYRWDIVHKGRIYINELFHIIIFTNSSKSRVPSPSWGWDIWSNILLTPGKENWLWFLQPDFLFHNFRKWKTNNIHELWYSRR